MGKRGKSGVGAHEPRPAHLSSFLDDFEPFRSGEELVIAPGKIANLGENFVDDAPEPSPYYSWIRLDDIPEKFVELFTRSEGFLGDEVTDHAAFAQYLSFNPRGLDVIDELKRGEEFTIERASKLISFDIETYLRAEPDDRRQLAHYLYTLLDVPGYMFMDSKTPELRRAMRVIKNDYWSYKRWEDHIGSLFDDAYPDSRTSIDIAQASSLLGHSLEELVGAEFKEQVAGVAQGLYDLSSRFRFSDDLKLLHEELAALVDELPWEEKPDYVIEEERELADGLRATVPARCPPPSPSYSFPNPVWATEPLPYSDGTGSVFEALTAENGYGDGAGNFLETIVAECEPIPDTSGLVFRFGRAKLLHAYVKSRWAALPALPPVLVPVYEEQLRREIHDLKQRYGPSAYTERSSKQD